MIVHAGKTDVAHAEQPLVVTTTPISLLRCRRSLYEALLQLEQQGAVVIERDLPDVDLVLSPSACMCIWTEEQILQARSSCADVMMTACKAFAGDVLPMIAQTDTSVKTASAVVWNQQSRC